MDTKIIFKNSVSTVYITNECIIYNGVKISIQNSHYSSDYIGRIETENFNLKWSKDDLFIYKKPEKVFIETLKKISDDIDYNTRPVLNTLFASSQSTGNPIGQQALFITHDEDTLLSTIYFQVTGDRMLKFESFKNKGYILTDIHNDEIFKMTEFVTSKSVFQYKSQEGFILFIDNKNKRYRWKNIPIGKF